MNIKLEKLEIQLKDMGGQLGKETELIYLEKWILTDSQTVSLLCSRDFNDLVLVVMDTRLVSLQDKVSPPELSSSCDVAR